MKSLHRRAVADPQQRHQCNEAILEWVSAGEQTMLAIISIFVLANYVITSRKCEVGIYNTLALLKQTVYVDLIGLKLYM